MARRSDTSDFVFLATVFVVTFEQVDWASLGRASAAAGDPAAARVRPLAWGLTAALAGTVATNSFYLTMCFYYFYVFTMLALAVPVVFARRLAPSPGAEPCQAPAQAELAIGWASSRWGFA